MTMTSNTEIAVANAENATEMRLLSEGEVEMVAGGEALNPFANVGCARINWGPMPSYNPWLDPYSPERRQA